MAKAKQLGLRLDDSDRLNLKRVAQRESRSEQDVLRDSLRMYIRSADNQMKFVESVERGWYELHSGLGETVMATDDFFESVKQGLRRGQKPSRLVLLRLESCSMRQPRRWLPGTFGLSSRH